MMQNKVDINANVSTRNQIVYSESSDLEHKEEKININKIFSKYEKICQSKEVRRRTKTKQLHSSLILFYTPKKTQKKCEFWVKRYLSGQNKHKRIALSICSFAKEKGARMIYLGSRARGNKINLFDSSVEENLFNSCPYDLSIIREEN